MRDKIQQRILDLSNLAAAAISIQERPRLEYQSNTLYDIHFRETHWIAKEFMNKDEFTTSPKREFDALNLLKPYDLAPIPIDFMPYPDYERPVVIYEFMDGIMWDRRKPSQDELQHLAETWLITHQATRDDLWMSRGWDMLFEDKIKRHHRFYAIYLEWAASNFPRGIEPVQQAFALYEKYQPIFDKLKSAQPTLFFSRSDPRFANIIARPDGRIGFVDWEDSGLRSPARTIADLILHPNQEDLLTDSEWQIFFDVYCADYPAPDDIRELVHWDRLMRSLTWFGGLLHLGVRKSTQGDLDGWHINAMPANQRLRRYLARIRAWETNEIANELDNLCDLRFFPID